MKALTRGLCLCLCLFGCEDSHYLVIPGEIRAELAHARCVNHIALARTASNACQPLEDLARGLPRWRQDGYSVAEMEEREEQRGADTQTLTQYWLPFRHARPTGHGQRYSQAHGHTSHRQAMPTRTTAAASSGTGAPPLPAREREVSRAGRVQASRCC